MKKTGMKKISILLVVLMLVFLIANSVNAQSFDEAKKLVSSGVSCSNLTESQLESIGYYYMELMQPGDAHLAVQRTMGGIGSENLKQVHIQMGRNIYCGENTMMGNSTYWAGNNMWGMMNMMNAMGNMMGGGWGAQYATQYPGYGMMGYGSGYGSYGFGILEVLIWLAVIIGIIFLIFFLYRKTVASPAESSALEILKRRYAGGEISKKQYEEMKKELS